MKTEALPATAHYLTFKVVAVLPFEYGVPAPGWWMSLCRMPAMGLESERNQSNCVLLSFVQGRRSLMVAST